MFPEENFNWCLIKVFEGEFRNSAYWYEQLPLEWTLQVFFMHKQQHYTLKEAENVKAY